ncbi:MAG: hypothetical protein P8176_16055 [Gammaproteobacteria bacterium]
MSKFSELERRCEKLPTQALSYKEIIFGRAACQELQDKRDASAGASTSPEKNTDTQLNPDKHEEILRMASEQ